MVFDEDDRKVAEELFERVRVESADSWGGVTRPSYGERETYAMNHVAEAADQLGLYTAVDPLNNLVMTIESKRPDKAIWLGSHLDSVPIGGNFDGMAGVVAALLVLAKAKKNGVAKPLVGLGLRGEESAWFGVPHVGAKALLGKLKSTDLDRCRGTTAFTLERAMRDCGVTLDTLEHVRVGEAIVKPEEIAAWWELHIEQGPVLESLGIPLGCVTGIAGSVRAPYAKMKGVAGHSGTTPHEHRQDAVMRFVDVVHALEGWRIARKTDGHDVRITCGIVSTNPKKHGITSIADEVSFSLDVRGTELALMLDAYKFASMYAGDDLTLGDLVVTKPCALSPDTYLATTVAARKVGVTPHPMPSGAGHDASVFEDVGVTAGMIFVRNQNGSHNRDEAMDLGDFMLGVETLYEVVAR